MHVSYTGTIKEVLSSFGISNRVLMLCDTDRWHVSYHFVCEWFHLEPWQVAGIFISFWSFHRLLLEILNLYPARNILNKYPGLISLNHKWEDVALSLVKLLICRWWPDANCWCEFSAPAVKTLSWSVHYINCTDLVSYLRSLRKSLQLCPFVSNFYSRSQTTCGLGGQGPACWWIIGVFIMPGAADRLYWSGGWACNPLYNYCIRTSVPWLAGTCPWINVEIISEMNSCHRSLLLVMAYQPLGQVVVVYRHLWPLS